jgi:hypothetical protein
MVVAEPDAGQRDRVGGIAVLGLGVDEVRRGQAQVMRNSNAGDVTRTPAAFGGSVLSQQRASRFWSANQSRDRCGVHMLIPLKLMLHCEWSEAPVDEKGRAIVEKQGCHHPVTGTKIGGRLDQYLARGVKPSRDLDAQIVELLRRSLIPSATVLAPPPG